ncbi:unnamed protein product [Enterobius vermicularis]|uniref:Methyltransf_21 domain-containing protein n=1 Tax=Enterobius vermicularis TaxID=51028 RepID=A0A0N4VQB7_ENTVE|nr:unnamed protein product [Enterobius vermicularis]
MYISLCERLSRTDENLPLLPLKNEFEYKHVKLPVRPLNDGERCLAITLGIGKLIEAEVLLRKVLPKHCEFFGVDPSALYNKALVESYNCTFFEAAIGDKTEGSKYFHIRHVALEEYSTEIVGRSNVINWLSIDIQAEEIALFPSLLKYGLLDKLNMHVCQLNMELHLAPFRLLPPRTGVVPIFKFLADALMSRRFHFYFQTL